MGLDRNDHFRQACFQRKKRATHLLAMDTTDLDAPPFMYDPEYIAPVSENIFKHCQGTNSTELLGYKVTNLFYLSVAINISRPNLEIKQCLTVQSNMAEDGAACFLSSRWINQIYYSLIKQCIARKNKICHESVL